jgi:hypothetical protein
MTKTEKPMKDRAKASIVRITFSGQYEGRFESVPRFWLPMPNSSLSSPQ